MAMFWEFFTFELRFRDQEHFHLRLFSGLDRLLVSLRGVGELRTGRQLQRQSAAQRPLGQSLTTISTACLFGLIIIAAIFGTSILRDFQRDTYQILFTKPISKFAYLGGRWAGSFVTTVSRFRGC